MVLSKRSGIVLLLRDDDLGSGNFDLAGSYHTKSKSETIKVANRGADGPIALTSSAAINPRRWSGEAVGPSSTSPLGPKAALVTRFDLWGLPSCLRVRFLRAPLPEKRARRRPSADG